MSHPTHIGRYEIIRQLGKGAMGNVYLARDPQLDREVAIKTLRDPGLSPHDLQSYLERLRNEAKVAARLQHPSIVSIFDVGEDASIGTYLVLEYVAGPMLSDQIRARGPLEAHDVLQLAEQIGHALDTAHRSGVIHRDVKPDNILIASDGRYKLTDFGIARLPTAHLTREGQFLGTPAYAAPETLKSGSYSVQSDIFSLCTVLYEALTGARAFAGTEALEVAQKVISDEPKPPSQVTVDRRISPALDAVILRGLSKDPSLRYASAAELAIALHETFGFGTTQHAASSSLDTRTPVLPNRSKNALYAGLLGVGLLGLGAFLVLGENATAPSVEAAQPNDVPTSNLGTSVNRGLSVPPANPKIATTEAKTNRMDAEVHANEPVITPDAAANVSADVLPESTDGLTAFEKEEAAKDALETTRKLIAAEKPEEAKAALQRARLLDPTHPDIAELESKLTGAPPQ